MQIPKGVADSLGLTCQQRSATDWVLLETLCFYRAALWALACKWRPKHATPTQAEPKVLH